MKALRSKSLSASGDNLVMRLSIGDCISAKINDKDTILQVLKINSSGSVTFIKPNETNISSRYTSKLAAQKNFERNEFFDEDALNDDFFQKALSAGSLQDLNARQISISPTGNINYRGHQK